MRFPNTALRQGSASHVGTLNAWKLQRCEYIPPDHVTTTTRHHAPTRGTYRPRPRDVGPRPRVLRRPPHLGVPARRRNARAAHLAQRRLAPQPLPRRHDDSCTGPALPRSATHDARDHPTCSTSSTWRTAAIRLDHAGVGSRFKTCLGHTCQPRDVDTIQASARSSVLLVIPDN